jgi:hypothetical protein
MLKFEELYNKLIKESSFHQDPEYIRNLLARWRKNDPDNSQGLTAYEMDVADRLMRHGGDDDEDEEEYYSRPLPSRKLGDEFTDKKGIRRIMIQGSSGDLIPAEKRFVSKKDGRSWERFFDGQKIKVKPAK